MSFCRMSDDNWKSDVYAYEDDGGFVVHVAANRLVGDIPEVPYILDVGPEVWGNAHQAQMAAVSAAERAPIGGPHDGESFRYATLRELREALKKHGRFAATINWEPWLRGKPGKRPSDQVLYHVLFWEEMVQASLL